MMKKIFILMCFFICSLPCFCQYIILPKSGDPIESSKCYRNDNSIEYLLKGNYIKVEADKIELIYKDGKEVNFNELPIKTEEANVQPNLPKQTTEDKNQQPNLPKQKTEEKLIEEPNRKQTEVNTEKFDIILKKDNSNIKVKIVEISDVEIKYKKLDNLDGPSFVIKKTEISQVVYSNGEVEAISVKKDVENVAGSISLCNNTIYVLDNKMTVEQAKSVMPNGYRLPTIRELECFCINQKNSNYDFQSGDRNLYWSSEIDEKGSKKGVTFNDCKVSTRKSNSWTDAVIFIKE